MWLIRSAASPTSGEDKKGRLRKNAPQAPSFGSIGSLILFLCLRGFLRCRPRLLFSPGFCVGFCLGFRFRCSFCFRLRCSFQGRESAAFFFSASS